MIGGETRAHGDPGAAGGPVDTGSPAGHVVLRPHEEGRILRGHRWVFSNEIERVEGVEGGAVVEVSRRDGRFIGIGFYNPHTLIAVRMLSDKREPIDRQFFESRVRRALMLRRRLYPAADSYRLAHGESDDLPGLIVEKMGGCLAIQTLCLGMDDRKDLICDALEQVLHPSCIIERNESSLREREGLPRRNGLLRGDPPDTLIIEEGDLRFQVDPIGGQKTGFYFDQRENRQYLRRFVSGARVLDAYCNDGAFSLHAAKGGAASVIGVDIAPDAIDRATRNAALNDLSGVCRFEVMEAGAALESLHAGSERFDVVILDPPSFTRSKRNVAAARRGYEEVNRKALRILRRGGILATASCSFHITDETFLGSIREAAFRTSRTLRLLEWRSQAPDHPILPEMPETRYLKFGVFQAD